MSINFVSVRDRLPSHKQKVLFRIGGSRLALPHVTRDGEHREFWDTYAGVFVRSDKLTNTTGPLGYFWRTAGMERFQGHQVIEWAEL